MFTKSDLKGIVMFLVVLHELCQALLSQSYLSYAFCKFFMLGKPLGLMAKFKVIMALFGTIMPRPTALCFMPEFSNRLR